MIKIKNVQKYLDKIKLQKYSTVSRYYYRYFSKTNIYLVYKWFKYKICHEKDLKDTI